jgi:hypothetical protein
MTMKAGPWVMLALVLVVGASLWKQQRQATVLDRRYPMAYRG